MTTTTSKLSLALPTVLEAYGAARNRLNINTVYDAQFITVRVPHYSGMQRGHTLRVRWFGPGNTYTSQVNTVVVPGPMTFSIPRHEVIDAIGSTVLLEYSVRRGQGQPIEYSPKLQLIIDPQPIPLPAPALSADRQRVTVNYPGNRAGHTLRVRWHGVQTRETNTLTSTGTAVGFSIPSAWVRENNGQEMMINYSISRQIPGERLLFSRLRRITL